MKIEQQIHFLCPVIPAPGLRTILSVFQYYVSRNYLEFISLKETAVTVYHGGGYLSGEPKREGAKGQHLPMSDARIVFGYVKRKSEELSHLADDFLDFLINSLNH